MTVVNLHPPKGEAKAIHIGGEPFVNVAGIMQMARDGDTEQCRDLVRFYSAEYRAREAQPLTVQAREWEAFEAAWQRMQRKHGVPSIGPLKPAPAPDPEPPVPQSIRTSELVIAGVCLIVHHLDNGQRVIERDSLNDLLEAMGGADLPEAEQDKLRQFMEDKDQ